MESDRWLKSLITISHQEGSECGLRKAERRTANLLTSLLYSHARRCTVLLGKWRDASFPNGSRRVCNVAEQRRATKTRNVTAATYCSGPSGGWLSRL